MKLNERERRFVEAYMANGGNGTQAAIAAGYSGKGAAVQALRLLRKAKVIDALQKRVDSDPAIATREDRQRFWTAVMKDVAQHIQARLKATELLSKSQGDFVERHEHSGPGGGPIALEAVRKLENLTTEELRTVKALVEKAEG